MNTEEKQTPQNNNTGQGYLVVHVTTARGAIPLEGARVTVRNDAASPSTPVGDVIALLISGRDGNTQPLTLPTSPRTNSLHPGISKPYESYHIEISLEGYQKQSYVSVPIFDGIFAIQPADLIPLSEGNRSDAQSNESRFFETTAPEL